LFTDVSGQPTGSIFKGQTVQKISCCPKTSVNNYQHRSATT